MAHGEDRAELETASQASGLDKVAVPEPIVDPCASPGDIDHAVNGPTAESDAAASSCAGPGSDPSIVDFGLDIAIGQHITAVESFLADSAAATNVASDEMSSLRATAAAQSAALASAAAIFKRAPEYATRLKALKRETATLSSRMERLVAVTGNERRRLGA